MSSHFLAWNDDGRREGVNGQSGVKARWSVITMTF